MAVLVERATSDLLAGPDWGLNLQICDAINQNNSYSRDVVKCIQKRLSSKSAKVQILTLTVLEMIIKNCGESVHQQVAEKGVLKSMVKIVKGKGDAIVREKILTLLKAWQMMFGGPKAKYPQYSSAYEGLLRSGVQFPVEDTIDTALLFAPAKQPSRVESTEILLSVPHATVSSPQIVYGLSSSIRPTRVDEVLAASENFHWSAKDLDAARECVEVLNEMLNALDPKDKQAVCSDVIVQLIEQCETNKKIVRQLVTSTSDESLLFQGLSLNDDLQQVLARFKLLSTSSSPVAEEVQKSSSGEPVHDQDDDDETEGEVSQLTHRYHVILLQ
ncbi:hypothetical protein KP509_16G081800 [Ceratopteris richardii]|uniref:VHS domain-containing protein n=1 Tax=Ceratopteris richardii TaxID=49495 RepID=A0A8T2T4Y9_CERRI|nr:hypothetical protein KP509_16G081800 [Ceratopteris richardii]